jgi:hypothetical protein
MIAIIVIIHMEFASRIGINAHIKRKYLVVNHLYIMMIMILHLDQNQDVLGITYTQKILIIK